MKPTGHRIVVSDGATRARIPAGTSQPAECEGGEGSNTMNGETSSMLIRSTRPSTSLAASRPFVSGLTHTYGSTSWYLATAPLMPLKRDRLMVPSAFDVTFTGLRRPAMLRNEVSGRLESS